LYNDAYLLFRDRLDKATQLRLSASRQRVELLEMFFPDSLIQLPRVDSPDKQAYILNALAQSYLFYGQPRKAAFTFNQHNAIREKLNDKNNLNTGLRNLANALNFCGGLYDAHKAGSKALLLSQNTKHDIEATSLSWLGFTLTTRGAIIDSALALKRSLKILKAKQRDYGAPQSFLAERAIYMGAIDESLELVNSVWGLANLRGHERDLIHAARLQGQAFLLEGSLLQADEHLHYALLHARAANMIQEEVPALIGLAEIRRRQKDLKSAHELLDDLWEPAERGPYPLFHADALNILAQIERDAGNNAAAIEATTKAYRLAWCDGEPYAYHWGLVAARKHLRELGAPEPQMPPFDASKYEPTPDVEINLNDEFYVELDSE
jgi:hypothetical protein